MTPAPTAVVRAWARDNGYVVSDRGRIPAEVQRAYEAAHQDAGSAPPEQQQWSAPPEQQWSLPPGQQWPEPGGQQQRPPAPGPTWPGPQGQPWPAPTGPSQWAPPMQPGREGFAVAALVLGIVPVCVGILGIVFGFVALNRIKKSGQPGRGMAITGIVCGSLWIVLAGVGFAFAIASDANRDSAGNVTSAGDVQATDLRIGDCLEKAPLGNTVTVRVVPCRQPHAAEVYAQFKLEGGGYPGDVQVDRFGAGGCRARVAGYAGRTAAQDYDLYYLLPTATTWRTGDRDVTCLLGGSDGGSLTGTLRTA